MRNLEKWSFRWQSCAMVQDIFLLVFIQVKFYCFYLSIVLNLVISFLPLHPSREEGVRHLYVFLRILNNNNNNMDLTDFSIKNKNFTFCDSKVLRFVSRL